MAYAAQRARRRTTRTRPAGAAGCFRPTTRTSARCTCSSRLIAGLIGGALSIAMRLELQEPGLQYLHRIAQTYNVFVTGHGLIMMFFVVMPALIGGFGNWFVPLHDRRAGHGLPAHEQHLVLAAAVARFLAAASSRCSSRARRARTASAAAGRSIRRCRPPATPARRWTSRSSRCTWRAPRRSWARSTSSPPS